MRRLAWLSLFAMLLLYIAPLISMSMSMPLGNGMPSMSAQHHQHAAATKQAHASAHMSWCAYCDLLPRLHGVFNLTLPLITATFLLIYRVIATHYQADISFLRPLYRPRAPPLFYPYLPKK